ncbi:transcriptional regulator [Anaerolineales bacterium HSG24]|nr:transcriptional regulator [Anaerolineales bacterium HSG24]
MKSHKSDDTPHQEQLFIDPLIHVPTRFRILSNLYLVGWVDFLFLRNLTGLTKGNLSSHLIKLEEAGYVLIKKEFVNKISRTTISLSDSGREAFNLYRKNMKIMLDEIPE